MKKFIILGLLFSTMAMGREIVFSKSVSSTQKKLIQNDLSAVRNMTFSQATPARTLQVLGIPDLNGESAYQWITDRIGYIMEDQNITHVKELLKNESLIIEENNFSYFTILNRKKQEALQKVEANEFMEKKRVVVIMSNIGVTIYNWGKFTNNLLRFNIDTDSKEKDNIIVRSPRVGIIQIGAGLFSKKNTINSRNVDGLSNSIKRLGTLFHEARHSDGNGVSLGFPHSQCPKGHDLAGVVACDESLNGSYTVGAVMLTEMVKACADQCSMIEKEMLKISILDSYGRVQKTKSGGAPSKDLDAGPESI